MLLLPFGAEAVELDTARTAAQNFLKYIGSEKSIVEESILSGNRLDPGADPVAFGYLFQLSKAGYLLVAADKSLTPIKAYSLSGDFHTLPPPYREFLLLEEEHRIRKLAAAAISPQADEKSETERRWDFLLHPENYRVPAYTPGQWLLTSKWNQDYPYNKFLPEVDGERVLAGCVSVAVGQLMKYHRHPATGNGISTYTWNDRGLQTILFRDYGWDRMPDELRPAMPELQIDEAALLLRDLGFVNNTAYGVDNSGAIFRMTALIEHFGYASTLEMTDNSVDKEAFFSTLRNEIDAERPVLISFPGHMGVADGYLDDAVGKTIHLNLGWGANHNDFYFLDDTIVPDPNDDSFSFEPDLEIISGIKPCAGLTCHADREAGDELNGAQISGSFDYDEDVDYYPLYLKGQTTLTGSRGYTSWAFFVSVHDADDQIVASNESFSTTDDRVRPSTVQCSIRTRRLWRRRIIRPFPASLPPEFTFWGPHWSKIPERADPIMRSTRGKTISTACW